MTITTSIFSKIKPFWPIIGLLLFSLITRLIYVQNYDIPFTFDHGKDSLAVIHMLEIKDIKLIGPWTSIPGLYFGPAWYYLLGLGYLATGYDPMGGIYTMILLTLVQTFFLYKYISKTAAVLSVTTPFWLTLSTSAWNPLPMTLLTIMIYFLLIKTKSKKSLSFKTAFFLGLTAAFGFHFSSAFAIFYPLIIISYLFLNKVKLKLSSILIFIIGFVLPFAPQAIFELKHNFVQTRAVIEYFAVQHPEEQLAGQPFQIFSSFIDFVKLSSLPFWSLTQTIWATLAGAIMIVWITKKRQLFGKLKNDLLLASLFCVFPLIGYQFLHFNVWYLYALAPVFTILVGKLLDAGVSKRFLWVIFGIYLLASCQNLFAYLVKYQPEHMQNRVFLPVKLTAIQTIRDLAGAQPYTVYTFVPHIYDYSYQYIYFWQAKQGVPLPVEFSYQPGEISYVQQKPELLANFANQISDQPAELIFLIIEKENNTPNDWWYNQWRGSLPKYEELETKDIGGIKIIKGQLLNTSD